MSRGRIDALLYAHPPIPATTILARLTKAARTQVTAAEIRAQKRRWIRSIGDVTDDEIIRVLPELAP